MRRRIARNIYFGCGCVAETQSVAFPIYIVIRFCQKHDPELHGSPRLKLRFKERLPSRFGTRPNLPEIDDR